MPSSLTYPGVYVEEVPSGVRTVTGVATSVTAFIGRARKGPVDKAVDITSFADFERVFGGLWLDSAMSFAVRDFYLNGGARAVIVRLFHSLPQNAVNDIAAAAEEATNGKDAKAKAAEALKKITDANRSASEVSAANNANAPIALLADTADKKAIDAAVATARATLADLPNDCREIVVVDPTPTTTPTTTTTTTPTPTSLKFRALSPGRWAGYLRVQVEAASGRGLSDIAKDLKVPADKLFNLTVTDLGPGGGTETHLNVTLEKGSVRRVDKVLESSSTLIAWSGDLEDAHLPDLKKVKGDALATAYAALQAAVAEDQKKPDKTGTAVKKAKDGVKAALDAALSSVDDGGSLEFGDFVQPNGEAQKKGLHALEQLYTRDGIFNLMCIAPHNASKDVETSVIAVAGAYCEKRRAMLLVDAPSTWQSVNQATIGFSNPDDDEVGYRGRNAALFFPRLRMPNPLRANQMEDFAACGAVAGIFARTDTQRGVWKSPAGMDASFLGVSSFTLALTDDENGLLNPLGINCLRTFPVFGRVLWGARTLRGADAFADEYKYTAVRRTALFIEESLYRALKWVVFEPNDEPLWAQIRLNVGAFMNNLFRQGAFQGQTKNEAYFVNCNAETTTQNDINLGIVNINVGFAPLKPAEFVVIRLQQMTGEIET
ncbi:phage tail sheath C-terminal domain-containing protein [Rhizobacter sp. Root1221]|uniref:phage tail sheath family protein n=1 Tax=Rhizobacter sp. Root1221 TaxID=1736433 RepID=UPI0006FAB1F9|nr:phage tail sheath C-terminal domain-containing protein [Rhizobacter sp. Root1221]KQW02325.1 hypothetical protein ASC87_13985 [Rhizobacter sp. Root1221]